VTTGSGPHMVEMFDHVLVDESTRTSTPCRVEIVRALRPDGRGLTVVGDDAQAIYGSAGSDARHLHDLASSLPGADGLSHSDHNFRSVQPILNAGESWFGRPSGRPPDTSGRATRCGRRPVLVRWPRCAE